MADYDSISDLAAASALDGTEPLEIVQSSVSVKATGAQIATYVAGASALTAVFVNITAGIADTVQITGEYQLTEDNEIDASSDFSDAMSAATVTFSGLPATTVLIHAFIDLQETGVGPRLLWQRSSGGTQEFAFGATFGDQGTNRIRGLVWMPTDDNTLYVTECIADTGIEFKIVGYKTGA